MDVDVEIKANTDKGTFILNFVIWEEDILKMLNEKPCVELDYLPFLKNSWIHEFLENVEWKEIKEQCFDKLPEEEYKLLNWTYEFETVE